LHLFTTYGKITPIQVQAKEQSTANMEYSIIMPVDVVFDAIEDLSDLAEHGMSPITSQKQIDMAYLILAKEPLLRQDLLAWNRRPAVDKTWTIMMTHFRDAQSDLHSLPTAGEVYHQNAHHGHANSVIAIADLVAQRLLDAAMLADEAAPPAAAANAVIDPREAALAQREAALLAQMQAMMANFTTPRNDNNRNRNPRSRNNRGPAPAGTNRPAARTPAARHYCWTHGMCAHSGADCNNRLAGHQAAATFTNMQGGSTNNCFWMTN
jgi:hypothetical protein